MNRNLQAVIEAFTAGLFAISAILTALRTVTAWDDLYTDPLTFDRPIMGRMALHGGGTEVNLLGVIAQPTNLILWGLLAAAVAAARYLALMPAPLLMLAKSPSLSSLVCLRM